MDLRAWELWDIDISMQMRAGRTQGISKFRKGPLFPPAPLGLSLNERFDDAELGIVAKNIGDHIFRLVTKSLKMCPREKARVP
ncbi:hypothetical protein GQ457_11G012300 [Hibiscus cannabinus]